MIRTYDKFSGLVKELKSEYNPDSVIVFGSAAKVANLNEVGVGKDIDLYVLSPASTAREVYQLKNTPVEAFFNSQKRVENDIKTKDVKLISMLRGGRTVYDPRNVGQKMIELAKTTSLRLTPSQRYSYVGEEQNLIKRIEGDMFGASINEQKYMAQWLFDKFGFIIAMQHDRAEYSHPKKRLEILGRIKEESPEMEEFFKLFQQIRGIGNEGTIDHFDAVKRLSEIAKDIV
jgi:hypothetical protein